MTGSYAFLRNGRQRWLLGGSVFADLADWLDYIAIITLLAFVWGEGPMVLAAFAVCLAAPYALVGPFLATAIDRRDPGWAMVLANLGRAVATAAILVAPNAIGVLAVVLLRSSVDSAFSPARQAMIQRLTDTAELGAVNGLHQAVNQTAKIVGPGLGGLLLAVLPFQAVIAGNAALSVLAALVCVPLAGVARSAREEGEVGGGLLEGFRVFRRDRVLLLALAFAAAAFFSFFLYDSQLALLAALFGLGQGGFALSVAASGAGGVVGAMLAGLVPIERSLQLMVLAAAVTGALALGLSILALAGMSLALVPFLMAMAALGGMTAMMVVPFRVLMQSRVPQAAMARASAASEAVITACMLAAPLLGGAIAASWGVAAAVCTGGALIVAMAAATLGRVRAVSAA